jgi:predicted site-specific integrase-resolvase
VREIYSIPATAAAIKKSQETVRRWCRRGLIGYQPVPGAQWVISEDDFRRLLGEESDAEESCG